MAQIPSASISFGLKRRDLKCKFIFSCPRAKAGSNKALPFYFEFPMEKSTRMFFEGWARLWASPTNAASSVILEGEDYGLKVSD
jgi:hypothetical protein